MNLPKPSSKWCVSIIAQYPDGDDVARMSYELLVESITKVADTNILFFILLYNGESGATTFVSYNFDPVQKKRVEKSELPKSPKNFYASHKVITEFFNEKALAQDADYHFLLTHGHGAGFGFFADTELDKVSHEISRAANFAEEDAEKAIPKIKDNLRYYSLLLSSGIIPYDNNTRKRHEIPGFTGLRPLSRFNKSAADKEYRKALKLVTVSSLSEAIAMSFGKRGKKIDFMYAMNCFMQMLETGLRLSGTVDMLMAAENFQFFFGPDYDSLFDTLPELNNSTKGLKAIAENIIQGYIYKYNRAEVTATLVKAGETNVAVKLSNICLASNKLASYGSVKNLVDDLGNYFMLNKDRLYPAIRAARTACLDVTINNNYGIVDVVYFCKRLIAENIDDYFLQQKLRAIIDAIQSPGEVVAARKLSYGLCTTSIDENGIWTKALCPHGLSFFFPHKNLDENSRGVDEGQRGFVNRFYRPFADSLGDRQPYQWPQFVIDYYDFRDSEAGTGATAGMAAPGSSNSIRIDEGLAVEFRF